MTHFRFSSVNPAQQYIHITVQFSVTNDTTEIQLPSWRPGRYELANFAKNVRNLKVFGAGRVSLKVEKILKDRWSIDTKGEREITVEYMYYANIINAGSTYLNAEQLYVNPVNCCVFTDESYNSPVSFELDIPKGWEVAGSMDVKGGTFHVNDFDELFDTPFIASNILQHEQYDSYGTVFHVWFCGEVKPDWDRLLKDFQAFTDTQIKKFTEFPVKEYHFLNQILPYRTYHGVEHQKSTVISLGPSYEVFGELYKELLGVSSHELYHTWNVKAIRPVEMFPYDFTKENYSKLGYICEGVTTYQGDLFLLKSGVFNDQQYFNELDTQLQKHFDNHGRFNYSVGESSFDTWLDGYVPGAPSRKVSIYTEGCLLAFVTDVKLRQATKNKYGIDEVMKRLYFNYALEGKGVSEKDYQSMLETITGESFQGFFDDYVNGCKPYESLLTQALDYLGLELMHEPSKSYAEGRLGMKVQAVGKNFKITSMYPGGPAETAELSIGDEIIAVNDYACNGELNKWLQYFDSNVKTVTVNRDGVMCSFDFPEVNRNFYMKYWVKKVADINNHQKSAFETWKRA